MANTGFSLSWEMSFLLLLLFQRDSFSLLAGRGKEGAHWLRYPSFSRVERVLKVLFKHLFNTYGQMFRLGGSSRQFNSLLSNRTVVVEVNVVCDYYLSTQFFSWGYVNSLEDIWTKIHLCLALLFIFYIFLILWFVCFLSLRKESTFWFLFLFLSELMNFIFIQIRTCGHSSVCCRGSIDSEESYKNAGLMSVLNVTRLYFWSLFAGL